MLILAIMCLANMAGLLGPQANLAGYMVQAEVYQTTPLRVAYSVRTIRHGMLRTLRGEEGGDGMLTFLICAADRSGYCSRLWSLCLVAVRQSAGQEYYHLLVHDYLGSLQYLGCMHGWSVGLCAILCFKGCRDAFQFGIDMR